MMCSVFMMMAASENALKVRVDCQLITPHHVVSYTKIPELIDYELKLIELRQQLEKKVFSTV